MKTRDEKGRFASMPVEEMTDEQREAIVYKSKLLNKTFESWADLQKAEDAYKLEHAKELELKEDRLKRVADIEAAAKEYLTVVEENKKLRAEMAEREQKLYQAYRAKLNEFAKDHKGYHLTYTYDGNNIEFKVEENRQNALQEYVDYQNKLMKDFIDNFWF